MIASEEQGLLQEDDEKKAGAVVPSPGNEGKEGAEGEDATEPKTSVDEETHICEARVSVGLGSPKLLMLKLVEQVAAETVVKAMPGDGYPAQMPAATGLLCVPHGSAV